MRTVISAIAVAAEETGAAFLLVRHRKKALTGNPLHDGLGSIGVIAACRSGLLPATDPDCDERRLLAVSKSNLGKKPASLAFHMEQTAHGQPKLVWECPSLYSGAELSNPYLGGPSRQSAVQKAEQFLLTNLTRDPIAATYILNLLHLVPKMVDSVCTVLVLVGCCICPLWTKTT